MKKIVNVGYIPLLESEKRIVNLYFENHTPDSGVTNTLSDFIASHQLTESYNTALNKTIMRKIAAESYIKILDETADSHQKLTNIFLKKKSINDPKIEKKCKKFFEEGKELRKDKEKKTKQVSDELEIESLSKEEVEQVQQVLSQYYRKIKPLAKNINNAF
ncbi:hypothetical protein [Acaryochloris marina]|uniref:Uncharacterized protein n=1 Tax=Acaryochloris marina (strain MBIC 11017) TaxID=329726 RepID=A8ZP53_ACAM1|nr:hypothetical protein [Acaryochloris marina]ABW32789.1 hypothetical protein AM1_E0019 [Acaryochloris marina MBIC11017]